MDHVDLGQSGSTGSYFCTLYILSRSIPWLHTVRAEPVALHQSSRGGERRAEAVALHQSSRGVESRAEDVLALNHASAWEVVTKNYYFVLLEDSNRGQTTDLKTLYNVHICMM